jgi:predicted enzyme related to lactoylglutathione lyase
VPRGKGLLVPPGRLVEDGRAAGDAAFVHLRPGEEPMPRPVHFEISAADPESLVAFYESVFGWKIQKWDGPADYWLVMTGGDDEPGINGGITRRSEGMPAGTVNTVDVPSLDEALRKAADGGATVAMPRTAVTGVGWLAYCQDPQGTVFGMMERDAAAS